MKFHILIYGCQMNYSDSARIKVRLQNLGWQYCTSIDEADVVIFDTCSVRQKAEDKISGILKDIPKSKKIWITGCMIQHDLNPGKFFWMKWQKFKKWNFLPETNENPQIIWLQKISEKEKIYLNSKQELSDYVFVNYAYIPLFTTFIKKFPNLELLFRIDDLHHLPEILTKLGYDVSVNDKKLQNYISIIPDNPNFAFTDSSKTAFVPIQTGCSKFCSYCIVPFARWLEKNRNTEEILEEVKSHLKNWKTEIILVWQIVNKHKDFLNILKSILKLDWLKRLRYTSPYPTYYSDEIFALHENEQKLCPQIHIPLQSGSDEILKKMNRWYSSEQFKSFISKLQNLKRDISITTDIIVWFPNETDEDFKKTLDLVEYSKFDMIYIWLYSSRPLTLADKLYKDNISSQIKEKRRNMLNDLLLKISSKNNQKEVGKIKDILITNIQNWIWMWYDEKLKNFIVRDVDDESLNNFVKAEVIHAEALKLEAKRI